MNIVLNLKGTGSKKPEIDHNITYQRDNLTILSKGSVIIKSDLVIIKVTWSLLKVTWHLTKARSLLIITGSLLIITGSLLLITWSLLTITRSHVSFYCTSMRRCWEGIKKYLEHLFKIVRFPFKEAITDRPTNQSTCGNEGS